MRLGFILRAYKIKGTKARIPQNLKNIPFQEIAPLKLKDNVSGKADSQSEVGSLHELSVVFSSMKNNDFNETLCAKEINALNKSHKEFLDRSFASKNTLASGAKLIKTGKLLDSKQINKYLRQFPNPK